MLKLHCAIIKYVLMMLSVSDKFIKSYCRFYITIFTEELKNISEDDVSLRTNQCALSNDRLRLFNAQNSATAAVAGAPSVSSNVINALNNNNKQMFTLLQTAISAGIINSQVRNFINYRF